MKYIVLTDIHLGQNHRDKIEGGQFCLLSNIGTEFVDAHEKSRVTMDWLSAKVSDFASGERVSLIVTGDLLDLSLSFMRESLQDLIHLLNNLVDVCELIYVPGNHDHHIWTQLSESKVFRNISYGHLPEQGSLYRTTVKYGTSYHHPFSSLLSAQCSRPIHIRVAYPSWTLRTQNLGMFYFTHGHLLGGKYVFMSDILRDRLDDNNYEQNAAIVNAPLIEFVYWSLLQVGQGIGANGFIEQIYADIQTGERRNLKVLIQDAVKTLSPDGAIPLLPNCIEEWMIVKASLGMIKQVSKELGKSSDRYRALDITRKSMSEWVDSIKMNKQEKCTIVYGHTHVSDDWKIPDTDIQTYNLGSWLVEPGHDEPETRILFIDDHCKTVEFV